MNHSNKYVAFEFLRAGAALLVCMSHIRNFLFVDFGDLDSPGFSDRLFYAATSLGHEAVIVFFVLSGYFVGGSVWNRLNGEGFMWGAIY